MAAPTSTAGTKTATALHHYRGLNCHMGSKALPEGWPSGTAPPPRWEHLPPNETYCAHVPPAWRLHHSSVCGFTHNKSARNSAGISLARSPTPKTAAHSGDMIAHARRTEGSARHQASRTPSPSFGRYGDVVWAGRGRGPTRVPQPCHSHHGCAETDGASAHGSRLESRHRTQRHHRQQAGSERP